MMEDSFQELQRRDQIEELLSVLQTDFPHSLHYCKFIKILQGWKSRDPRICLQILVPNPHNLRDGTSLTIFSMSPTSAKVYMVYSLEPSANRLKEALLTTNRIDWTSTHREWEAIHEKHVPVMKEVLKRKGCEGQYLPYYHYYMPIEKALDMEVRESSQAQLVELQKEDAHLVDSHWKYHTQESLQYTQACIQLNFGIGLRAGQQRGGSEELISWVVQTHYGGAGMLYTVDKHRQRGYAELLMRRFTKHVVKLHEVPSVVVDSSNLASIRLNEKIGYRRVCKVYWFQ